MVNCHLLEEGGPWGWVIVLASCCTHFLVTSITRCNGVMFSSFQREFMSTAAQTGAISSIMSATLFLGCKNIELSAANSIIFNNFNNFTKAYAPYSIVLGANTILHIFFSFSPTTVCQNPHKILNIALMMVRPSLSVRV